MLWYSWEVAHWAASYEYPQDIFLWNKKNVNRDVTLPESYELTVEMNLIHQYPHYGVLFFLFCLAHLEIIIDFFNIYFLLAYISFCFQCFTTFNFQLCLIFVFVLLFPCLMSSVSEMLVSGAHIWAFIFAQILSILPTKYLTDSGTHIPYIWLH